MLDNFHIITFISSTAAMAAKLTLQGTPSELKHPSLSSNRDRLFDQSCFRLIPIPPQIDASCGLCMKIEKHFEEIWGALKEKNINMENVYQCKRVNEELECTILTMQQPQ